MLALTRTVTTFPSVTLPSRSGGLPVEVALIAQLGHGAGDQMIASAAARQRGHAAFVDALDEPSVRIGAMDLAHGDPSSLYTFVVGPQGHPFHRHAGNRVFTAVSGSGGARLRFSTVSAPELARDPRAFVRALRHVDIPADCLFTVRFGRGTWHQFTPLRARAGHPALFALSCHTNELDGELSDAQRSRVLANDADIPSLTELLPEPVLALLDSAAFDPERVPTTALSLDTHAVTWAGALCRVARGAFGRLRGAWARWVAPRGFLSDNGGGRVVVARPAPARDSLLRTQLAGRVDHEDAFALVSDPQELATRSARTALAALLDGFLENRPLGVSQLMRVRNVLVKPLGLRTSPLGCPVSSLLGRSDTTFAGRYPVLAQFVSDADDRAEVVLGADDKHLSFRSCIGVRLLADGRAEFTLGTRVRTHNAFGRFYIAAIDRVHRGYVSPAMLRLAADHAIRSLDGDLAGCASLGA